VEQFDTLIPALTVHEMLAYTAELKRPLEESAESKDAACEKLVAGFSVLAATFDRRVVDGTIKGIESGSQATSSSVRRLTTGSARDYIMMAALGTLLIAVILWGVA
ncbi:MAG: hypothetical protein ACPHX2_07230, partial [Candidatus Poseidoniaceae archaeon]